MKLCLSVLLLHLKLRFIAKLLVNQVEVAFLSLISAKTWLELVTWLLLKSVSESSLLSRQYLHENISGITIAYRCNLISTFSFPLLLHCWSSKQPHTCADKNLFSQHISFSDWYELYWLKHFFFCCVPHLCFVSKVILGRLSVQTRQCGANNLEKE